jgi:hypothetical protein
MQTVQCVTSTSRCLYTQPPHTHILKMANAISAETLDNSQHSTRIISESQRYTKFLISIVALFLSQWISYKRRLSNPDHYGVSIPGYGNLYALCHFIFSTSCTVDPSTCGSSDNAQLFSSLVTNSIKDRWFRHTASQRPTSPNVHTREGRILTITVTRSLLLKLLCLSKVQILRDLVTRWILRRGYSERRHRELNTAGISMMTQLENGLGETDGWKLQPIWRETFILQFITFLERRSKTQNPEQNETGQISLLWLYSQISRNFNTRIRTWLPTLRLFSDEISSSEIRVSNTGLAPTKN